MTTYITADYYDDATQIMAHAIDTSIRQDEIVFIEVLRMTPETILSELDEACDGAVEYPTDTGRTVEYWGCNLDGDDWRVHVTIRAEADEA